MEVFMLAQVEIEKSNNINDINCSTVAIEATKELTYIERLRLRELAEVKVVKLLEKTNNLIL
jgi:hypothetical protein